MSRKLEMSATNLFVLDVVREIANQAAERRGNGVKQVWNSLLIEDHRSSGQNLRKQVTGRIDGSPIGITVDVTVIESDNASRGCSWSAAIKYSGQHSLIENWVGTAEQEINGKPTVSMKQLDPSVGPPARRS